MVGVEIVDDRAPDGATRPAAPETARKIQHECLRRGLILELGGRFASVVRLLPPLIVSDSDIGAILDRFEAALKAVERGYASAASR
jgi:diaminobutyrate-2-oxoglutarate transaminase